MNKNNTSLQCVTTCRMMHYITNDHLKAIAILLILTLGDLSELGRFYRITSFVNLHEWQRWRCFPNIKSLSPFHWMITSWFCLWTPFPHVICSVYTKSSMQKSLGDGCWVLSLSFMTRFACFSLKAIGSTCSNSSFVSCCEDIVGLQWVLVGGPFGKGICDITTQIHV